jgi:hypothetical protein
MLEDFAKFSMAKCICGYGVRAGLVRLSTSGSLYTVEN